MPQLATQIIGHRGAAAYAPENTLASFDKALSLGCKFVEFDVTLSADGEPFVFHDDSLSRTTNGHGDLAVVNANYLYSLDAGYWFANQYRGQQIPHLGEVLQWLTTYDVQANIEIKPAPRRCQQTVLTIISYINRYWPKHKPAPLISSFDLAMLFFCHQQTLALPLGLLLDQWDPVWLLKAKELECYSVHCNKLMLNAQRAQQIKAQGFKLLVYTVNHQYEARKLFAWGVDAVFSDYPNLLSLGPYCRSGTQ